ncbi:MAG: flagellar biosynthesis protein FlgC [Deltaproteobacteria bacterium]|nr:flagellar biosynthesis protein FlgC [Deltaproteobacteria bacterium]
MISSISSSLSSLDAFGAKMDVTANNVANVESEGFKKSRADLAEGPNGAVEVEISRVDSPGSLVYEEDSDGQMVEKELSNVDLTEEIPQTIIAQRGYEANLKLIATRDDMLGSVLDILG